MDRKGRNQASLLADDMILYIQDPKISTKGLLELINSFRKVAGYKISTQQSRVFLYTNKESTEKKNQENNAIHNCFKNIKYLGMNLTKEAKDIHKENYSPLKKEIREDIKKWKDIQVSG